MLNKSASVSQKNKKLTKKGYGYKQTVGLFFDYFLFGCLSVFKIYANHIDTA